MLLLVPLSFTNRNTIMCARNQSISASCCKKFPGFQNRFRTSSIHDTDSLVLSVSGQKSAIQNIIFAVLTLSRVGRLPKNNRTSMTRLVLLDFASILSHVVLANDCLSGQCKCGFTESGQILDAESYGFWLVLSPIVPLLGRP